MMPNSERRVVQFELQGSCPQNDELYAKLVAKVLNGRTSIAIWVYWPPLEGCPYCNSPRSYCVTEDTRKIARRVIIYDAGTRPGSLVCEHMGRIIE